MTQYDEVLTGNFSAAGVGDGVHLHNALSCIETYTISTGIQCCNGRTNVKVVPESEVSKSTVPPRYRSPINFME